MDEELVALGGCRLALHLGRVGGLGALGDAQLNELAAADLTMALDRPLPHRERVDPELRVLRDLGGGRRALAVLEVDDVHPALGVELDPVHRAAQHDLLAVDRELGGELVLGGDRHARVGDVPRGEPHERLMGVGLLALADPGGLVPQPVPHGVEVGVELLDRGALETAADDVGGHGVHDQPEPLGGGGAARSLGLAGEEPLERAAGDAREARARQPQRQ